MVIYRPYTYLLGWTKLNKYYYGVRFAKKCNPEDLWKKYFTSSKHVKHFVENNGDPDLIEIRKIFQSSECARIWESKVLRRMKVAKSNTWINQTDNISISPQCCSHKMSETNKELNRKRRLGHKESEETKAKKRYSMLGKNLGKKNTDEQREKKSKAHKGISYKEKFGDRWQEEIEKRNYKKIGVRHSEERKKAISEGRKGTKNKKPRSAEYCNQISDRQKGKKHGPRSEEAKQITRDLKARNKQVQKSS